MKRTLALALVMVLAILSFGYCADANWGNTDTNALLRKTVPSYLASAGREFGGTASIASETTTIPSGYAVIRYADSAAVGQVCNLANGTKGQLLTIFLYARTGSNTIVITPATATGFATITLDAAKEFATLQYLDSTIGWVIVGTNGTIG